MGADLALRYGLVFETLELTYEGTIDTPETGWIAAECYGPYNRKVFGGGLFKKAKAYAHTSPVWISVEPNRSTAELHNHQPRGEEVGVRQLGFQPGEAISTQQASHSRGAGLPVKTATYAGGSLGESSFGLMAGRA